MAGLFHLLLCGFCYLAALFPQDIVLSSIACLQSRTKDMFPCVVKSNV